MTAPRTRLPWGPIALLATLIGVGNFVVVITSDLAERHPEPWKYPLLCEMTGAYTVLLLLPILLRAARRWRIERSRLLTRLPLHLGLMVAFGVSHTLLMWGSRTLLYGLLGWGSYDYGLMHYRFLMEGQKQALVYWAVYVTVTILDRLTESRLRELNASRLEKELTEARLAALKTQLNPHFLFNTLNMIASHVRANPGLAERMIGHLSDFLRVTLRQGDVQEVSLAKELELLDSYLALMKARFEDRLEVTLDIGDDARGALVPHLVLQPIVENAVLHGMANHERPGQIRISASRHDTRLRLTVDDNGPGLNGAQLPEGSGGVGLSNTAQRLQHLHGDGARLELANRPEGGLRVAVELPYRTAAA